MTSITLMEGQYQNIARTLVRHNGFNILVITSDVTHTDSLSPYETGVFYTDGRGKRLHGQITDWSVYRSEYLEDAWERHVQAIGIAIEFAEGRVK